MQLYLAELIRNPLRTKMITSAILSSLGEILATYLTGPKNAPIITPRVPAMAAYGGLIASPLGHVLIGLLQGAFAGKTSAGAKIAQIITSNLTVSPILNVVFLISMSVISGARDLNSIIKTVKAGFLPIMKVSWTTSPLTIAFAQAFVPQEAWVPFFSLVAFVLGTYNNVQAKKRRAAIDKQPPKTE
ncbi:hypothetical protein CANCADRAFT_24497 [Tortispora caseinolytica NRRL Y-17796]|uniref:Uncharacterized protein n=1 Tax=Tortispora caseinolytica NRRL Y-17796 TaxID=767744 RepID=A0A1E4TGC3_9ASCO|nr:hypothetical protein CANCADRAFT_24497 [Tortispora caseinolytica NRRL Y-17796]